MSDDAVRLRSEGVEWRSVEDEVVVLDGDAGEYIAVTGSGAALWPLLLEGASRAALVDELRSRFDVDEATAARDVESFVSELAERGLLATG
jgi:hypothetical protein